MEAVKPSRDQPNGGVVNIYAMILAEKDEKHVVMRGMPVDTVRGFEGGIIYDLGPKWNDEVKHLMET